MASQIFVPVSTEDQSERARFTPLTNSTECATSSYPACTFPYAWSPPTFALQSFPFLPVVDSLPKRSDGGRLPCYDKL